MTPIPPRNPDDFVTWSTEDTAGRFNDDARRRYEVLASAARGKAAEHTFFQNVQKTLERAAEVYYDAHAEDLFGMGTIPTLHLSTKPYTSVVDKLYRKNVLWNSRWPDPPEGGWLNVTRCYERLNDIVRAQLVCKFIDGPPFLAKRLSEAADDCSLPNDYHPQGRDEGYYAYHWYTRVPVDVLGPGTEIETVEMNVEIQISTQLQHVLLGITHGFYETSRLNPADEDWKWSVDSARFRAGYLSHTLHLLEAIILDLRSSRK